MSLMRLCWRHASLLVGLVGLVSVLDAAASPLLYSFGSDGIGVGRSFTTLDAASGSVQGAATMLGGGDLAFNGGLTYRAADGRFYAIANDGSPSSQLVSFSPADPAAFVSQGASLGAVIYGGLAAVGNTLYALGQGIGGGAALYSLGFDGSGLAALGDLEFGLATGLTYNRDDGQLYAIGADDQGAFVLERIALGSSGWQATALFALGDGSIGFNGGLAYDADDDLFYAIGNDSAGPSQMYRFDDSGPASLTALGGGAFGTGFVNAGLALAAEPTHPVPEPATLMLLAAAALAWRLGACRRR